MFILVPSENGTLAFQAQNVNISLDWLDFNRLPGRKLDKMSSRGQDTIKWSYSSVNTFKNTMLICNKKSFIYKVSLNLNGQNSS